MKVLYHKNIKAFASRIRAPWHQYIVSGGLDPSAGLQVVATIGLVVGSALLLAFGMNGGSVGIIVAVLVLTASVTALLTHRYTGRVGLALDLMLTGVFIAICSGTLLAGGLSEEPPFWLLAVPMVASTLGFHRRAMFWMIATCVFVFALYLMERGGYAFPPSELEPLARLTQNMFVLVFFLLAAFVGYALNDTSRRRAILMLNTSIEKTKVSEKNFRLLIEQSPDPIIVHDTQRFLYANQAIIDLLGYERDEFLDLSIIEFILPEDRDVITSRQAMLDKGDQPPSDEIRCRCKDGSIVIIEINAHTTMFDGRQARIVMGRDITRRRSTEEALRRSEEQFRKLIEEMPDPIAIHSEGRFLFMNDAALDVFGYTWEEAKAIPSLDFIHPEDRDLIMRRQAALDRGELSPAEEIRYLKRDGSIMIGEGRAFATTFEGKKALIIVVRDVTLRKEVEEKAGEFRDQLEQRVKERTRDLKESEERYKDLIERTPDAVWRLNREGVMTFISPAIKSISGYDPEEMTGLPPSEFRKKFLVGASVEDAKEFLNRRMQGVFSAEEIVYELTCYRKDGSEYIAEFRSIPILNDAGEIIEIHGITRDISDRKILEEQLRQSQKMETVGQLAGGIAHDFNNLLTAINGYSELLLPSVKPGDPLHYGLKQIKNAGERAATLTRQLLAFGRKQILQLKVIDLGEIVIGMEDMLRRLIGEHLELNVQCDPHLQKIKTDPGQMEQVVMNLVINARDAMSEGGNLTLSLENVVCDEQPSSVLCDLPAGEYVMLSVSDTGIGMNQETLSHIFEPFYTTKEVGKGTGLGLSTVFGIVKQSGGGIEVVSEPGKGSTFRICLPQVEASELDAEDNERPASHIEGSETIMLVEDDDIIRELLKRTLERLGYTVLVAAHAGEALLVAERHKGPINLMVTDVVMPKMSGHELVKRLSPHRPEMSVLYISGYDDATVSDLGLVDVENRFLQKPFGPKAVGKKIREILDKPASAH